MKVKDLMKELKRFNGDEDIKFELDLYTKDSHYENYFSSDDADVYVISSIDMRNCIINIERSE